jgi:hypothetical protein
MKNNLLKYYIASFYLCSTFALFAQPGSENSTSDLESADAPAAPINDYLWILAIVGLIFVFIKIKIFFKKKEMAVLK